MRTFPGEDAPGTGVQLRNKNAHLLQWMLRSEMHGQDAWASCGASPPAHCAEEPDVLHGPLKRQLKASLRLRWHLCMGAQQTHQSVAC